MLMGCGCEGREDVCVPDVHTPNLDRIAAEVAKIDDATLQMSERVHNLESEMQVESLRAAVGFMHQDGWSLAVVDVAGKIQHSWGIVSEACLDACVAPEDAPIPFGCRGVRVGATGHILCGSVATRETNNPLTGLGATATIER